MMKEWIAVALGGMLGAVSRHALSGVFSLLGPSWLPISTLVANVIGCFAIGVLAQWSMQNELSSYWWVIGIRVGLLGGLTTFSSFALDLVRIWHEGRATHAMTLFAGHVVIGLLAVAVGMAWAEVETRPVDT